MKDDRRTRLPHPWRRTDGGTGKLGSRYDHPAGYHIEHCGHPTAIWPYALYGPNGRMIRAKNGRAWRTLDQAADEVARRCPPHLTEFAQALNPRGGAFADALPFSLRPQVARQPGERQPGLFEREFNDEGQDPRE